MAGGNIGCLHLHYVSYIFAVVFVDLPCSFSSLCEYAYIILTYLQLTITFIFYRDLRESVSKLLQDVKIQDSRQKERSFNNILGQQLLGDQIPVRDNAGQNAANTTALNIVAKPISRTCREMPRNYPYEPSQNLLWQQSYANGPETYGKESENRSRLYEKNKHDLLSDKESDLESCSIISESTMSSSSSVSKVDEFVYHTTQSQTFDDQYSSLFCDSGEFRLNMADLSANIKKMQQALQTAKGS